VKKIQIIILAGAGVASFASAFAVTWFVKKSKPVLPATVSEQTEGYDLFKGTGGAGFAQAAVSAGRGALTRGMTEKQLQSLIYDIRERMKEYKSREKELDLQEERLSTARASLQEDIDRLNELRVRLTATVASLKQQETSLRDSMVEIGTAQKTNMQHIAGRYDKMDVSQASKIIISMVLNNQLDDATKIIYYMSERTSGKLLGEIGNTKPEFAVTLCAQLKRLRENQ
jgi:flagellar motility protein MotE (MotC chaperone)